MNIKHSIIVITYNQEFCLKNTIQSLLEQTELPFEIIICDDASTDSTFELAAEFEKQYPKLIKAFRNKKNLGIEKNTQYALTLTSGNVISYCSGDDTLESFTVEKINRSIIQNKINPDIDLFTTITGINRVHNFKTEKTIDKQLSINFFKAAIRREYSFIKLGISKNLLSITEYPPNLGLWADWAWDVNIAYNATKVMFLNDCFYNYTVGIGVSSVTKVQLLAESYIKNIYYINNKYNRTLDKKDIDFLNLELAFGTHQIKHNHKTYLALLYWILKNIDNITLKRKKLYMSALTPLFIRKAIKKIHKPIDNYLR